MPDSKTETPVKFVLYQAVCCIQCIKRNLVVQRLYFLNMASQLKGVDAYEATRYILGSVEVRDQPRCSEWSSICLHQYPPIKSDHTISSLCVCNIWKSIPTDNKLTYQLMINIVVYQCILSTACVHALFLESKQKK